MLRFTSLLAFALIVTCAPAPAHGPTDRAQPVEPEPSAKPAAVEPAPEPVANDPQAEDQVAIVEPEFVATAAAPSCPDPQACVAAGKAEYDQVLIAEDPER